VGPIYPRSDVDTRAKQLESCYRTSLNLAVEKKLKHIVCALLLLKIIFGNFSSKAFPSISTGIYGYPIEDATHIALDLVRRFCESEVGNKVSSCNLPAVLSLMCLSWTVSFSCATLLYSRGSLAEYILQVVWSNKDKGVYECVAQLRPNYSSLINNRTLIPEYFPAPDPTQEGPPGDSPTADPVEEAATQESEPEESKAPVLEAPVPESPVSEEYISSIET
jgi:hypothetical protein